MIRLIGSEIADLLGVLSVISAWWFRKPGFVSHSSSVASSSASGITPVR
jgi:hypothetical protein